MGGLAAEAEGIPGVYLDACATTPPAQEVMAAMADAAATAWANPSSLHGFGLAAADCLERSRWRLADLLGAGPDQLIFCSGGTEAIHTALLGSAAALEAGRVVISAVEHPATVAAAGQLARRGWSVETWPVDRFGVVNLERIDEFLAPPTRLLSLIWGQSEVGAMQPIEAIGRRCRAAGVRFHLDAVQVVGHQLVRLDTLPVDLLSCTAHKLQGPRGVGALLVRPGVSLEPMIGGGGQEGGRRGGTEPVLLAAGFAKALDLANGRLNAHGGARSDRPPEGPAAGAAPPPRRHPPQRSATRPSPGASAPSHQPADQRLRWQAPLRPPVGASPLAPGTCREQWLGLRQWPGHGRRGGTTQPDPEGHGVRRR